MKCSLRAVTASSCSLAEVHPLPSRGDTRWSSKGLLIWGLQEEQSDLGRRGDENLPNQKETANGIPHVASVSSECMRRQAGQTRTMS